jgi:hypothetical protein
VPIRCQFVLWRIAKSLICRVSSVVEQRFCKPLVGSSNLSPGTAFRLRDTISCVCWGGSAFVPGGHRPNSPYAALS